MEHLLFHWDDIMEILIDDLVEEEVNERNAIEQRIANHKVNDDTFLDKNEDNEEIKRDSRVNPIISKRSGNS